MAMDTHQVLTEEETPTMYTGGVNMDLPLTEGEATTLHNILTEYIKDFEFWEKTRYKEDEDGNVDPSWEEYAAESAHLNRIEQKVYRVKNTLNARNRTFAKMSSTG